MLRHFISPTTYPINSIFSVVVYIYNFHIFEEAVVATITEKYIFPISMATFVSEKSRQIMQLINPDYP